MYIPRPAKLLFTINDGWNKFIEKFGDSVNPWTRLSVERMLACSTCAMGVRRYCCSSPTCTHSRFFCQSCKSKACSACGFKATEQWIAQQQHILPDCDWQHITFTMPHLLWPFFNNNWPLLNALFRAATRAMLRWAHKQSIEIGIFCALHTYGRELNQHPHIHVSVTRGGLDIKHGVWRALFFKKKAVEEIWRGAIIRLLRHSYDLIAPGSLPGLGHIRDRLQWRRYLKAQYGRYWKVHFAKKTRGAWHSVKYLGRYLKRPPVSAAKLRHYSGGAVMHHYYDHRTQEYRQQTLTQEEMMAERGIIVDHSTLHRWVIRLVPLLDKAFRRYKHRTGRRWRMDETYIKIKGQWKYLYRAVDTSGQTVDFLLTARQDAVAALRFFRKAIRHQGEPEVVTIDKSGANTAALTILNADKPDEEIITIRQNKYLNNLVEQDHRNIKRRTRPMLGFKSFRRAQTLLAGIELLHMIRKGQLRHPASDGLTLAEQFYLLAA